MARTVRSTVIAAPPAAVWRILGDPKTLPRWWPDVVRIESVRRERFTAVVATRRGKSVRLDLRVEASEERTLRRWSLEVAGSPFQRLLESWTTTVELTETEPGRTRVTITEQQRLRGSFKLGLPLQVRPARRRLDSALAGLAALTEP